jgi:predicted porin
LAPEFFFVSAKMKVSLQFLVIVLAGLSAEIVHAEDSLKLSGTLDYGYYKGYNGKSQFGSISRSNIALDANKVLMQDLSLTFKLNSRFFIRDPNTGNYLVNEDSKYLGSGEATAGLKGQWGHLRFGRALTAMRNLDWNYDAWSNYDAIASPAWWLWHGSSPADPNASARNASFPRLNNGVFYASPELLPGLSFDVSYGTKNQTGDVRHGVSATVRYVQEKYDLMLAQEKTPAGNSLHFLAGRVNMGQSALMMGYSYEDLYGGGINRSATVSGSHVIGPITYLLGYGRQVDYRADFVSAGLSFAYNKMTNLYLSYGNQGKGFWGTISARDALGIAVNYRF